MRFYNGMMVFTNLCLQPFSQKDVEIAEKREKYPGSKGCEYQEVVERVQDT